MNAPFPKLCRGCKWSAPEKNSEWTLRCTCPRVNANDAWALSATDIRGTSCSTERDRGIFAPCGKRGKLWEPLT